MNGAGRQGPISERSGGSACRCGDRPGPERPSGGALQSASVVPVPRLRITCGIAGGWGRAGLLCPLRVAGPAAGSRGRGKIGPCHRGLDRLRRLVLNGTMMKRLVLMMMACLAVAATAQEAEHLLYPFEVTLGGQKAEMQE